MLEGEHEARGASMCNIDTDENGNIIPCNDPNCSCCKIADDQTDGSRFVFTPVSSGGYTCPNCGCWVDWAYPHFCNVTIQYWPQEGKTDKAYRIVFKLVTEGLITLPDKLEDFTKLVEKIASIL